MHDWLVSLLKEGGGRGSYKNWTIGDGLLSWLSKNQSPTLKTQVEKRKENCNQTLGTDTKRTYFKPSEQLFPKNIGTHLT